MSKVFVCALVLVFLAGPAVVAASLEYTVTVEKGASTVHVTAVARQLLGSPIELIFKTEASYVSQHVSNFTTSVGIPRLEGEGRWRVDTTSRMVGYDYDIEKVIRWRPNVPWGTSNDSAVYFDDECGILMAPYFFIYPARQEFTSIKVRFILPDGWVTVVPYTNKGDYYEVQKVTTSLMQDFINRSAIYMGPMEFYSEATVGACTIRFGKLERDDFTHDVVSQADVDAYVEATAKGIALFEDLFGTNPYSSFALVTNFRRFVGDEWLQYRGGRYSGNGYQYWPEHRWDELLGHLRAAWIHRWYAPLLSENTIAKGVFENYYGHLLAWELYADPVYLGKLYHHYLMYEWMYEHHERRPESYTAHEDEYETYFRWEFVGLLLDEEIRERTRGDHRLSDAFRWLYQRYANTGHAVTPSDLERAIGSATGVWLDDIFSTYVYNDEKLPVYGFLSDYRTNFEAYSPTFEASRLRDDFLGHTIPFFIEIVLAASLAEHLAWGIGGEGWATVFSEYMLGNYDIAALSEDNVTEALSHLTGEDCSDFFTHWEDSYGRLDLDELIAWLQDYSKPARATSHAVERARTQVQLDYLAPEPHDALFAFTVDAESVCIDASGETVSRSLDKGAVEIFLRPLGYTSLYRYVVRGTTAGWQLHRESVYTRKRELIFDLQSQIDEGIQVCIPRDHIIIPRTSPNLQIRIRCFLTEEEELPIWYVPNLPTGVES